MKGKKKYIVPLLLAGVTASAGIVTTYNQQQTMVQAEETQSAISNIAGAELKLTRGFDDNGYMLGKPVTMPSVSVTDMTGDNDADGYKVTYVIKRGNKVVKEITKAQVEAAAKNDASDAEIEAGTFNPTYTGVYNVSVKAEKSGVVVSEITDLKIVVSKSDAVITLPTNSEYVIPAKIATEETNLKIPAPEVTYEDAEGNEVTKSGANAVAAGLKVKLVTPTEDGILDITDQYESETNTFDVEKDQLETAGTYQIRYEYYSGDVLVTKLESNFQVIDAEDFDEPTKLYMKLSGSVPSTGNVNTDIELPKVTVYTSKSSTDGINAHITVKVIKIDANGKEISSKEIEDYEDYTFKPTEEGNYIVSYTADLDKLYGISSEVYKPSTIISVKDNKAPSVLPTYEYTLDTDKNITGVGRGESMKPLGQDETAEDVLVNRKVDVPTVAVLKDGVATFRLPAIYATDNKYGYSDLILTREVAGNGISKQTVTAPANEISEEIKLYKTGTYEIRYIAKEDTTNGKETKATYTLTVVDEATAKEKSKTEVKLNLNVSTSSVSDKDTIKFAPTAKDDLDDYVDVVAGYVLVKQSVGSDSKIVTEEVSNKIALTEKGEDGKYEISIADILKNEDFDGLDYTHIRVYADATADSTLLNTRPAFATSTTTTEYKDLAIIDSTKDQASADLFVRAIADKVLPEDEDEIRDFPGEVDAWNKALYQANGSLLITKNGDQSVTVKSIDEAGYALDENGNKIPVSQDEDEVYLAAFNQNAGILKLPAVKFTDADEHLKVRVSIYDNAGNMENKYTSENAIVPVKNEDSGLWEYTVDGISFNLSNSEVYTVVYRAEDTAGNVTVRTYGIRVNDTTPPDIAIADKDKFGMDIEVGEFFEVPTAMLRKGNTDLTSRDVYWQVTYSDGALCDVQATGFTPLTEGTFFIKYYGTDAMGNFTELADENLYYVTAKDTTSPTFDENLSMDVSPIMAWPKDAKEVKVDIPVVYATDPIRNDSIDVKYVITSPDGSKVTLYDYDTEEEGNEDKVDIKYFTATKQGIYTVEYSATDAAGNTSTMKKEIAIGDCQAPTITWSNNYEDYLAKDFELNSNLELKLSNLNIKDNVSKKENVTVKVKLVKPDKTTELKSTGTPNESYKWQLTETGSYTLNVTVTDEAGKSETYKYNINVPSEDTETKEISPVWGTVLVVVSVVILAGVVIYFVVSSRKKATVKGRKTRKND